MTCTASGAAVTATAEHHCWGPHAGTTPKLIPVRETPWPKLRVWGNGSPCPPKPALGKATGKGREIVPRWEWTDVQKSPSTVWRGRTTLNIGEMWCHSQNAGGSEELGMGKSVWPVMKCCKTRSQACLPPSPKTISDITKFPNASMGMMELFCSLWQLKARRLHSSRHILQPLGLGYF